MGLTRTSVRPHRLCAKSIPPQGWLEMSHRQTFFTLVEEWYTRNTHSRTQAIFFCLQIITLLQNENNNKSISRTRILSCLNEIYTVPIHILRFHKHLYNNTDIRYIILTIKIKLNKYFYSNAISV